MTTFDERIKCRICGYSYGIISDRHLKTHNTTKEEYLKKFPDAILVPKSFCKRMSESVSNNWKNLEFAKQMSVSQKEYWKSPRALNRKEAVHTHDYSKRFTENKETKKLSENLTWSWIAGFFQAEGNICLNKISIGQKNKEPLDLIYYFLQKELSPLQLPPTIGPYKNGKSYIHFLNFSSHKTVTKFMSQISSQILGEKRTYSNIITPPIPINDEWIAGFWEGDGYIYTHQITPPNFSIRISFAQKDRTILEQIQQYLHKGKIYSHLLKNKKHHDLVISETFNNHPITQLLLQHCKTTSRINQINKKLNKPSKILHTNTLQQKAKRAAYSKTQTELLKNAQEEYIRQKFII